MNKQKRDYSWIVIIILGILFGFIIDDLIVAVIFIILVFYFHDLEKRVSVLEKKK